MMHTAHRKVTRYSILGLSLLVAGGLFYASFVTLGAANPQDNIKGWIWNAYQFASPSTDVIGLGWTSLNCLNDFDNDNLLEYQCDPTNPYGLSVTTNDGNSLDGVNDYLEGCAWSSAYGWVCFNGGPNNTYQCDSSQNAACADLSTDGVAINAFNDNGRNWFYHLDSPAYNGGSWGQLSANQRAVILSLWKGTGSDEEQGYVGFPIDPTDTVDEGSLTNPELFGCIGCGKKCVGNKDIACTSNADCGASGGLCGNFCDACLNTSTETEQPVGDPKANPNPNLLCWDCGNDGSSTLTKQCKVGDADSSGSCVANRDKNTCDATSCTGCAQFTGVIINEFKPKQYEMCGWGYHSYTENSLNKGLGWLAFNSEKKLGDTTFIDIVQGTGEYTGSIFSGGNIYSPSGPPLGKYNAAYIIEASGDITNWYSENAYRFSRGNDVPTFITDSGSGVFSNVLGRLDYTGLVTDVTTGSPPTATEDLGTNKFGATINYYYDENPIPWGSWIFNNELWYMPNDVTITGMVIEQGEDPDWGVRTSGAGIMVVNGDLAITGNITYGASVNIGHLKQIPSLVWIVKGDVTIAPAVTRVAGTFILLGDGGSDCPAISTTHAPDGCGRFSTGDSGTQLVINGSVLARQFNFQRTHSTSGAPSEQFQPDGRLQANPASGLSDFSRSVPRFSSGL